MDHFHRKSMWNQWSWPFHFIFFHDFTLFVVDIHHIRQISLSHHFHFYPTLEPKCVIDLKSCHIEEIYESISECCAALLYSSPCLWPSPKTVPASFSTSPGKFRWLCLKWRQKAVIDSCGINISFRWCQASPKTASHQSERWRSSSSSAKNQCMLKIWSNCARYSNVGSNKTSLTRRSQTSQAHCLCFDVLWYSRRWVLLKLSCAKRQRTFLWRNSLAFKAISSPLPTWSWAISL